MSEWPPLVPSEVEPPEDYYQPEPKPVRVVCQSCGWSGRRLHPERRPCPRCWSSRVI